jgi:hypothetical protein
MLVEQTPFTLFESFERDKNGVTKRRSLRFDLNALADFEQEVGMGIAQLMQTKAIFATTRALLWAGLKHQDRGLTVDRIGDLIGTYIKQGGDLTLALQAAFQAAVEQGALGSPDKVEETPQGNAPAPALTIVPPPTPTPAPEVVEGANTGS